MNVHYARWVLNNRFDIDMKLFTDDINIATTKTRITNTMYML